MPSPHALSRGNAARSSSTTDAPSPRAPSAAAAPAGPAPTIATSNRSTTRTLRLNDRLGSGGRRQLLYHPAHDAPLGQHDVDRATENPGIRLEEAAAAGAELVVCRLQGYPASSRLAGQAAG